MKFFYLILLILILSISYGTSTGLRRITNECDNCGNFGYCKTDTKECICINKKIYDGIFDGYHCNYEKHSKNVYLVLQLFPITGLLGLGQIYLTGWSGLLHSILNILSLGILWIITCITTFNDTVDTYDIPFI